MEIIMDYHLMFIVISFVLLLLTLLFQFIEPTREKAIASMLLAGFNYLICIVNAYGFFRIGLVGYTAEGESVVTAYPEMLSLFAIFMLLHFLQLVFIFHAYYLMVIEPWKTEVPKLFPDEY